MESVFLSIVVAVRNDNYGGDFNNRLQNFIDWNTKQLEEHEIKTEIILVCWNPVAENAALKDTINFPTGLKHVTYRMVIVPTEIHEGLADPSKRHIVPMFEFIAKNAGISRANGEYILCTNADVLIHPEIFRFIAAGKLQKSCFYRTNRVDFSGAPEKPSTDRLFQHAAVVSLQTFAYKFHNNAIHKRWQYQYFRLTNSIRVWFEMFRFRWRFLFEKLQVSITYDNAAMYCHCHNSGDFMLMHREHWFALKGYPEGTFVSTHTDSVFTFMAYMLIKEVVLPFPVFHQEHERRYEWKDIEKQEMFTDMFRFFQTEAKEMLRLNKPKVYNSANWGLQNYTLPELEPGKKE